MRQRIVILSFLALILLASGCTLRAPGYRSNTIVTITPTELSISGSRLQPSSPTPVVHSNPSGDSTPAPQASLLAPSPLASDPLRFTFPTLAPDSISLWRPPLYPVPWEPSPHDHFYLTRPIGAQEVNWPLARYRYGYLLYAEPHTGIDIPAPKGTEILAAGPGVVIWAGYGIYFMREENRDPYGIAVAIKHDFGYEGKTVYTVYGHMDQVFVYRGQRVESGEKLGLVGETGKVSGPHLHFEVRIGDNTFFVSRNPELWISPPQGMGVLVGRIMRNDGEKAPRVPVKLRSLEGKGNYEVLSYAQGAVNSDDYYNENLALGDLPAGRYEVFVDYEGVLYKGEIVIQAGQVTYITFRPKDGIVSGALPTPKSRFIPPDATTTPIEVRGASSP
jgi:murein DD-endopeptidase MepM/ murein hydrolase activator NlpD